MSHRFFCRDVEPPRAVLTGDEAHHLSRVMRAAVGERIVLFDGSGAEFEAQIARISKRDVELTILACRQADRELPFSLTLAVALPKGERQRWLIEKSVELGVTRLVPIVTARGGATCPAPERLLRYVVEASKQCGRNRLMEVDAPKPWQEHCSLEPQPGALRWIAHTGAEGEPPPSHFAADVQIAVGPEGGWEEEEIATALAAGWRPVSLGPRILRVETAATVLAALAQHCRP